MVFRAAGAIGGEVPERRAPEATLAAVGPEHQLAHQFGPSVEVVGIVGGPNESSVRNTTRRGRSGGGSGRRSPRRRRRPCRPWRARRAGTSGRRGSGWSSRRPGGCRCSRVRRGPRPGGRPPPCRPPPPPREGSSRSTTCSSTVPRERCSARFSRRPLLRLSATRTRAPRATRASTRCEPMNDAPPVTRVGLSRQSMGRLLRPHSRPETPDGIDSSLAPRRCWDKPTEATRRIHRRRPSQRNRVRLRHRRCQRLKRRA